jgi:prephenate dehydratase
LQVRMCAGGLPGANIDDVTSIHSHPKALEQCSTFIGQLPQSIQKIETSSTVAGVEQVADLKDIRHIALASKSAIEALGLTVLKEDVADLSGEENVTKFLVVHKNGGQKLPIIDYEHHAALITPRGGQRGILAGALTQIATCGIDLDSIHSRSIGPSDYAFYLGMQREGTPEEMGVLAQWLEVSQTVKSVKWLGSWNEEFKN